LNLSVFRHPAAQVSGKHAVALSADFQIAFAETFGVVAVAGDDPTVQRHVVVEPPEHVDFAWKTATGRGWTSDPVRELAASAARTYPLCNRESDPTRWSPSSRVSTTWSPPWAAGNSCVSVPAAIRTPPVPCRNRCVCRTREIRGTRATCATADGPPLRAPRTRFSGTDTRSHAASSQRQIKPSRRRKRRRSSFPERNRFVPLFSLRADETDNARRYHRCPTRRCQQIPGVPLPLVVSVLSVIRWFFF